MDRVKKVWSPLKNMTVLLLFLFVFQRFCSATEIDYTTFRSIEEVIEFETSSLSKTHHCDFEQLADLYASRGESLLLCNRFKEALDDFQQSYAYSEGIQDTNKYHMGIFRALFGQMLAYGDLDEPEMIHQIGECLNQILHSVQCSDCHKSPHVPSSLIDSASFPSAARRLSTVSSSTVPPSMHSSKPKVHATDQNYAKTDPSRVFLAADCEDVPIYGPDQIPIQDCRDFIDNTTKFTGILISKAKPSVRALLTFTIDQLASQAKRCCNAGGFWKGCVQPLMNKYHQWNQKWKTFGIPPDPAWD